MKLKVQGTEVSFPLFPPLSLSPPSTVVACWAISQLGGYFNWSEGVIGH